MRFERDPRAARLSGIQEPRHSHLEGPGWLLLVSLPFGQRAGIQFQAPSQLILSNIHRGKASDQALTVKVEQNAPVDDRPNVAGGSLVQAE